MKDESTGVLHSDITDLDNYAIIEKVGEGGYGIVYKAKQLSTGQLVAIKILNSKDTFDGGISTHQKKRFERETKLCAEINHPNIVKLIDRGTTQNGQPFAVFEYITGETLKDILVKSNGLSAHETADLMEQVLDALISIHEQGIIHRDLKPQNIMIIKTGSRSHVKILDFGIGAFVPSYRNDEYKSLTIAESVVGTPAYSAPEQLRGEPATIKSDLYAWGLITLECLTGEPVMKGRSIAEIFQRQLSFTAIPLPLSISNHPLGTVLKSVLDKNAANRVSDATTLLKRFSIINFNTIVGEVNHRQFTPSFRDDRTLDNQLSWNDAKNEKRQITVLCAKLSLSMTDNSPIDLETLDTISKDQIHIYSDVAIRFGGHIVGSLADHIVVYFGYPQVSDNDARRAGRTALELISQVQKRSALLHSQYGVKLDLQIGMNSGIVLAKPNTVPEGLVTNIAFNLLYNAEPANVLVSETTQKLLTPFLEFKPWKEITTPHQANALKTYLLVGEYQTEAFLFMNPSAINRKMIGREQEMQDITDKWQSVLDGNGSAVYITGQAGIGKSKLLFETKSIISQTNSKIKECRCLPEYHNNALYPFFELLQRNLVIEDNADNVIISEQIEQLLTSASCDLNVCMPIICSWLSLPLSDKYTVSQLAPNKQKEILFESLKKCLFLREPGMNLLLLMEDLHWADPTSIEFIEYLFHAIEQDTILLLLTARLEFTPSWNFESIHTITLNALNAAAAKEIVSNVLNNDLENEVIEYISSKTDGVPLFIEEFSTMLLDNNYLSLGKTGIYSLKADIQEKSVPETLQALLNTKLDKAGFAKETIQLASVIGREFPYELLLHISLKDESSVQADLNLLVKLDILFKKRQVSNEVYIFRHALICDSAYESMLSAMKQDIHLKIANIMETQADDTSPHVKVAKLETLAHHLYNGKRISNGIQKLVEASQITVRQSSNKETKALCVKALEWMSELESTSDHKRQELGIRQTLMSALMALEGYGSMGMGEQLTKIQELSNALDDTDQLFPARAMQVNFHMLYNNWEAATKIAEQFYTETQNHPIEKWVLSSTVTLGQQYFLGGKFQESADLLETALQMYKHDTHKHLTFEFGMDQGIYAASILVSVYFFLNREDEIPSIETRALEWAKDLNHDHSTCTLYFGLCSMYIYKGDKDSVNYYNSKLMSIGSEEQPNMFFLIAQVLMLWSHGKIEELKEAIAYQESAGILAMKSFWNTIIAKLELREEKFEQAKERMIKALSWINQSDGLFYASEINRLLGIIFYALGDKDSGLEYIHKAKDIATQQGAMKMIKNIDNTLQQLSEKDSFSNELL